MYCKCVIMCNDAAGRESPFLKNNRPNRRFVKKALTEVDCMCSEDCITKLEVGDSRFCNADKCWYK